MGLADRQWEDWGGRMKVLCIDPGATSGIALYLGQHLESLTSGDIARVIERLADERPDALVVEDSTEQSHVWNRQGAKSISLALKIGRNIGEIDGYVKTLKALCAKTGTAFVGVSPKAKGAKVDAETFKRLTGYLGKTNEHQRDAGMLIFAAKYQLTQMGRRA